jgi:hypothetical protein
MKLPDEITVSAKCSDGTPVGRVILTLKVRSGTKNPYFIDFPMTDDLGFASISSADFRGQYEDHWEQGLMDYNGRIEDASPLVDVALFDTIRLRSNRRLAAAWPLLKNEIGRWTDRDQKIDNYLSSENERYTLQPFIHNLEASDHIEITL